MTETRNRSAPVGSLPVDYSYLFGNRHATVRHDPQVRCHLVFEPADLRAISQLIRGRSGRE